MSYAQNLYKRIKKQKRIKDMFPLLFLSSDDIVVCRNSSLVSVIKVTGKDYDGMSDDSYSNEFRIRKQAYEIKSDYVSVSVISMKKRVSVDATLDEGDDLLSEAIAKRWKSQFSEVFRTYHYLILTTHTGGLAEKIGKKVDQGFKKTQEQALIDTRKTLISKLDSYSPELVKGDDLKSFFATLLNGRDTRTSGNTFNDSIANQMLRFPNGEEYCIYGRGQDAIYSSFLSIQNYPREPNSKTIENIFSLPVEVNIYQTFKGFSDPQARRLFESKKVYLEKFGKGAEIQLKSLKELKSRYENDELTLMDQYFCIEVLADSVESLNEKTELVKNTIERSDATCYRESINIEALFWSRFPTLQHYNVRKRPITSENAGHYATLSCIGEGYDTCRFGNRPVTLFKTTENSQFSFTWHDEPSLKGEPLGHTAFIGDTGVGKTTLFTFLVQQCLSFPEFKAVLFDRLQGMELFTNMFGGDFVDFNLGGMVNPLKIEDTKINRMFLNQYLKKLLIVESDTHVTSMEQKIKSAIDDNFNLKIEDRCFENIAVAFGAEGSILRNRLEKWMPSGAYGSFLNADKNSLNFDQKITTLDFTNLLEMPELLKPMTTFLFHQIENAVSYKAIPHILGFDEAQQYFQDEDFATLMLNALKMVRKKLGVVGLLFQNAEKLENMPNGIGSQVIGALANVLVYPDPNATKSAYCDFLGLTDTEFKWVKETNPKSRQVLFKRLKTGESVRLNADLSVLNGRHMNYLNAFSSGGSAVRQMHELKKTNPNSWRNEMLRR